MFLDEVLDSLDTEGVEAAIIAVQELAEDRCVVLVTHNTDVKTKLRPEMHYVVSNGGILEAA